MSSFKSFVLTAAIFASAMYFSCNNNKKIVAYQCPMNCQTDTVYASVGKCPVCGMDLEGIEKIDSTDTVLSNNK